MDPRDAATAGGLGRRCGVGAGRHPRLGSTHCRAVRSTGTAQGAQMKKASPKVAKSATKPKGKKKSKGKKK